MDLVAERIEAWEAAGLIDPATASRLRLAEAERSAAYAMTVAASAMTAAESESPPRPSRAGDASPRATTQPADTVE